MTRRHLGVVAGIVIPILGIGLAAAVLDAREASRPLPVSTERLLYLRQGQTASRVFLSFDALAADVYWVRAIQHYGRDRKSTRTSDRFSLLQPLLDVTTTLDPHFNIAYRFGAIFLSMAPPNGPARLDQAIALLEKGLRENPKRWQYAHDIGFIHYWYTRNYPEAARWFNRAADIPGAPEWIRPLAAVTLAQGGDRRGARLMLEELRTVDESFIRQAAERLLTQLQALDVIDLLQSFIEQYQQSTGRYPDGWDDLVRARLLPGRPTDATDVPFVYNPATHTAALAPESSLNPLPPGLERH